MTSPISFSSNLEQVEFYETKNGIQPAREIIFQGLCISFMWINISFLQMVSLKRHKRLLEMKLRKQKNIGRIIWIERNRTMSRKFDDFLQEQLQDPEIRKEYESLQPEHTVIQAMIDARKKSGMTQKELAEITGIAQGDISKLERGSANPSIRTLQRLAKGMGMILKIEFTPEQVSVVK